MAFFPLALTSDDRSAKGCTPLILRNVVIEPQAIGAAKRARYVITPTMGRSGQTTLTGGIVRGVFCRPGVQNGALFAVGGSRLYKLNTDFTKTDLGPVAGASGTVLFDSVGANVALLAAGSIYQYDGTTLSINTDIGDGGCPADAFTLASLAGRVLTSQRHTDTFNWSAVNNGLNWPAAGFASSARQPDEIRAQVAIAGELFSFGAATTQVWNAVGGSDAEAFDIMNVTIDRGIAGRDCIAKVDSSAIYVGDDRVVYLLTQYAPMRLSNREIEAALAALTDDQLQALQAFSYMQGSHLVWVLRMPTGKAYAYDMFSRTWSERTTWGASNYQACYYAYFHAAGKHIIASEADNWIYTWEPNVYSDNTYTHERVFMVHVPVEQRTIISSIALDIKVTDQPVGTLSAAAIGQNPTAKVTFYTDGGSLDSIATRGVERQLELGSLGSFNYRPIAYRLGMASAADGMLIKIIITDPVNFAFSGVWVNEKPT